MKKSYAIIQVEDLIFEATKIYEHYRGMAGISHFEREVLFKGSISDCYAIVEADKKGYLTLLEKHKEN